MGRRAPAGVQQCAYAVGWGGGFVGVCFLDVCADRLSCCECRKQAKKRLEEKKALLQANATAGSGESKDATAAPSSSAAAAAAKDRAAKEEEEGDEGLVVGLGGLFATEDEEEDDDEEEAVPDGGWPFPPHPPSPAVGAEGGKEAGYRGWRVGDVVGCLLDLEAGTLAFHVNGVFQVRRLCGVGMWGIHHK